MNGGNRNFVFATYGVALMSEGDASTSAIMEVIDKARENHAVFRCTLSDSTSA